MSLGKPNHTSHLQVTQLCHVIMGDLQSALTLLVTWTKIGCVVEIPV